MAWTDEQKQQAIDKYTSGDPTLENSVELVKAIAEEMEQSPNGVRMVLSQAGVYVKKDATPATTGKTTKEGSKPASTRVSKESQIAALAAAIKAKGLEPDDEILSKLTGKAAAYFVEVLGA